MQCTHNVNVHCIFGKHHRRRGGVYCIGPWFIKQVCRFYVHLPKTHKKSSASSVGGVARWVLADISPGLTALVGVYIVASVVAKYHLQLSNITYNFHLVATNPDCYSATSRLFSFS